MKYTVVWRQSAENELARLWADAENRCAVATAADLIDGALQFQPESAGESRSGAARILIVAPLVVTFDIVADDRLVRILSVRPLVRPGSHQS